MTFLIKYVFVEVLSYVHNVVRHEKTCRSFLNLFIVHDYDSRTHGVRKGINIVTLLGPVSLVPLH